VYLDRDDIEACISLFSEDSVYEVYGRQFEGAAGLRKMLTGAPGGLHLGGVPVVELVDADHARSTQSLLFVPTSGEASRNAVYTDDLRRTADGWRITRRRCQFMTTDGLADRPAG
jgi:hypothetical protein